MRAFDFAAREYWAIQTEVDDDGTVRSPHLKRILDIALRSHEPDFEAVAQKMADRTSESGVLEMHGNVGVIHVIGPIFRYANLFTMISGATSVAELATGFRAMVDDPAVRAIVLNIDSPGGEVAGISELAAAIYDARGKKQIVAYADDAAASGAYWLASAAGKLVASDTAQLGSIGVVGTVVDRGPREGVKTYQFVSSQSPLKRPDLETPEGRATMQQRIDDLAAVFVSAVARNRGVAEAKVLADFGRGGMMIASKAVAAGMADEVGSFEGVLAGLKAGTRTGAMFSVGGKMAEEKIHTAAELEAAHAAGRNEGLAEGKKACVAETVKAERTRIGAILNCPEAKGRDKLAQTIALEMDATPETAAKLLAAAPVHVEQKNPLAAAMAGVPNPNVGIGTQGSEQETVAEMVRTTVAAYKIAQGVK